MLLLLNLFKLYSIWLVEIHRRMELRMLSDGLYFICKRYASGHVDRCVVELFFMLFSWFLFLFLFQWSLGHVLRGHGLYFWCGISWHEALFAASVGEHIYWRDFIICQFFLVGMSFRLDDLFIFLENCLIGRINMLYKELRRSLFLVSPFPVF